MIVALTLVMVITATSPQLLSESVPAAVQKAGSEDRLLEATTGAQNKQHVEREKRFMQRAVEDLRQQKQLAEEAVSRLDREIYSIKPLESLRREADLRKLSDWYYDYILWLDGRTARVEADLSQVMEGVPVSASKWSDHYSNLRQRYKLLSDKLSERIKSFEDNQKHLEDLLDRRTVLSNRLRDLEERLQRIEERVSPRPGTKQEENEKLRRDITIIQNDLASLPFIDEDLLRHYVVVIEEGRGELERLEMKLDEYEVLQQAVPFIFAASPDRGDASSSFLEVIRHYEAQRAMVNRRIDDYYRRRSSLSPAGTLRGGERSQELWSYYQDQISRLQNYLQQLSVLASDWRYEVEDLPVQKSR